MSGHIFLSYSRKDKARAKKLADTFENMGWDVWWDREIPPGQSFDDVIEKALTEASCIVVLWSKNSVHSQWVRTEAAEGKRRRILIPIQIDELDALPLAFRRTQVAPLIDWNGSTESEDFKQIVAFMSPFLPRIDVNAKPVTPITPPATPVIKAADPINKPASKSAGLSYKSIIAIFAAIVIAIIAYKAINISPNNSSTKSDERIAELEAKQRQLEQVLADKKLKDKTKQDEAERIKREQELKDLQAEKQHLLDLEREKKALEEVRKRKAEADEEERLRLLAIQQAQKDKDRAQQPERPKTVPVQGSWYVVTASPSLKVRMAPRKSGKRIGLIPKGEKIQVLAVATGKQSVAGKSGYWVEIEYKQQKAYVFDAFLRSVNSSGSTSDASSATREYIVLAKPSLTIRKTPELRGDKKGKVKKGKVVTVLGKASALQTLSEARLLGKNKIWQYHWLCI